MWRPAPEWVAEALAHAERCQPLESCGVIADGAYFPLRNEATENDAFMLDMRGWHEVAREHAIEAVVHSHVYHPPLASDGDRASCERVGLPWLIVAWPVGNWTVLEPCGWRAPLVGRQWAWGSLDCYGLIRDAFADLAGIDLPDFDRDWAWWMRGGDIIAEHFAEAGFRQLPYGTPPQHLDVMGMRIAAPVVNHLGVFLAPDVILHQRLGALSVREVYGGTYQRATQLHLRHERLAA